MIPIPPWMLTPLFKYGAIAVGALIVVGIVFGAAGILLPILK